MKNKKIREVNKRGVLVLLSLLLVMFSLLPISMAWFAKGMGETDYTGHAMLGYFESGTGKTPEEAYVISSAKHLYNLAWLQNKGVFAETTYFRLKPGVTLNMAGTLMGADGETSGAIPPIGTKEHPFVGVFDGQGAVIQNLWVSTDEDDWYEHPAEYVYEVAVEKAVGLFGYVGRGANVSNFYVENIEVTTTLSGTESDKVNLGIIAGYVDGDMSDIGVKNAKLSFKDGVNCQNVSSDYSLIGYKTANVIWDEIPSDGNGGGDLIINPTEDKGSNIGSSTADPVKVPESKEGTAYYVGPLTNRAPSSQPTEGLIYKYKTALYFEGAKKTFTAGTSSSVSTHIDLDDAEQLAELGIEDEFVEIYDANTVTAIWPVQQNGSLEPDFSTVTGHGTYPAGGVWFKPTGKGNCSIAFSKENNRGDEQMSVYRYLRDDETGRIVDGSLQEIVLVMSKSQGLGNKTTVYFHLPISAADAAYEYVIGGTSDTSSGSCGFIFLKLAATNIRGENASDGYAWRALKDIDFVKDTKVDLTAESWEMHRSILALSGSSASAGAIYYDVNANTDRIYYFDDSDLAIDQKIQTDPEADEVNSATGFPVRQNAPPST